jgi:1,4-dihydroxy-2-naphthoate octaprenyltransferase
VIEKISQSIAKLLRVGRPQYLISGLTLFVLGALLGVRLGAPFSLPRLTLGYLVILLAQLSVHYSNDYFDVAFDRPGGATPLSGGSGVLLEHPELKKPVIWIAVALIGSSLVTGLIFLLNYRYPYWMFGFVLIGNLLGWVYSAPPFRLASRGLGEPAFTFIGGFLIPGMGYLVMKGKLDLAGTFILIPLLLYGLASILSVEIPDMDVDLLGDKRTWVVRKGRGFGFSLVGTCLFAATGYFFIFPSLSMEQIPLDLHILGILSLLPLSVGMVGLIRKPLQREPATRIAIWTVLSLTVFSLLANGYLIFLVIH